MEFVQKSRYNIIFEFALSTGMRGGEIRGLTWNDIDFTKRIIHVRGTLVKEHGRFSIEEPKTISSTRDIPMLDNVYSLLKRQKKRQLEARFFLGEKWRPVEGLDNLVFLTGVGTRIDKEYLKNAIDGIVKRINISGIEFEHITVHTFRHTLSAAASPCGFLHYVPQLSIATRCIDNGVDPHTLKNILGHSTLAMTMDLYEHVLPDRKAEEIQRISHLF